MSRSKETGFKYNDSYHAFFDGYSEKKDPQTGRIERVYIADYYEHDMSNVRHALLKAGYAVLFLTAVICLLPPLWFANTITISPVVVILEFAAIIILIINAVFLFLYITARRTMTVGEHYQTTSRAKKFLMIGMIVYSLLFLAYLVFLIISLINGNAAGGDVIIVAGALVGSLSLTSIWLIESKVRYRVLENETPKPEDSVEIWR